jgi:S-adenosylmethionine-diacylglycerol 3-amino-3-carboxypropyl transferase
MPTFRALNTKLFNWVHTRNLIYNTCWEDPRLDRQALQLTAADRVVMITSAGCNALDYALTGPAHIHAVDINPRQNALLELKLAGIRTLTFEDFYQFFGKGSHPDSRRLYRRHLRSALPFQAREYWDSHLDYFSGRGARNSFYFHGTAGFCAHLVNCYIDRIAKLRKRIDDMLAADSLSAQQGLYFDHVHRYFWKRWVAWLAGRNTTLYLMGVPDPQIHQIKRHYSSVSVFIKECLDAVFGHLPLADNYFWRVYLTGRYTRTCCPEYIKADNFTRLKSGLVDRITTHTSTLTEFLRQNPEPISRFVLLDHMDWLSTFGRNLLQEEWQAIVDRATPNARIIWRSGGINVDYVDPIEVRRQGSSWRLGDLLSYRRGMAAALHAQDRVHTYGSFYIADLQPA